ncbi:MAG: acyl-CoA thioesterase [Janthinobacterium lividum]
MSHQTTHRLRFNDTDKLGHVNNAVFAVMLEQGRSELLFETGLPMGEGPQAVVIVRLELDFVAEMRWPGEVLIDTAVTRLGGKSFNLRQTLTSGGTLCARADTVLVVMDRTTGKSVSIDPWRDALAVWQGPGPEVLQETRQEAQQAP